MEMDQENLNFARNLYIEFVELFDYVKPPTVIFTEDGENFVDLLSEDKKVIGLDPFKDLIKRDPERAFAVDTKDFGVIYFPKNEGLEDKLTLAEEIFHAVDNVSKNRKEKETLAMFGRYLALRMLGESKEKLGNERFLELVTDYVVRKEGDTYIFSGIKDEDKFYNGRLSKDIFLFILSLEYVDFYEAKRRIKSKIYELI